MAKLVCNYDLSAVFLGHKPHEGLVTLKSWWAPKDAVRVGLLCPACIIRLDADQCITEEGFRLLKAQEN